MQEVPPFGFETERGDLVILDGGLRAFTWISACAPVPDEPGVELCTKLRLTGRIYEIEELRLRSLEPDSTISADMLRRIPVAALLRRVVHHVIGSVNLGAVLAPVVEDDESRDEVAGHARVALYYRLARLMAEAPTKYVQERLHVSRATAVRRISAARAAGFLDADEIAQAGAPPSSWDA